MAWQRNASDVSRLYCEATLWAMFQNASRRSRKTAQAEPIIVYATHERKHPYAARLQRYAATVPLLLFVAGLLSTFQALAATPATQRLDTWLSMVRQTPYWASRGVAANLKVIRRWVLLGESYCAGPPRHLLFDHRGRFLGYIDDGATPQDTTVRLNRVRERLARAGRVAYWSPGAQARVGYPFALACHQPFVDMEQTIARMSGAREEYRLWGTWDGMRIGEPDRQVSLVQLIREVFHYRQHQGRYTFPETPAARAAWPDHDRERRQQKRAIHASGAGHHAVELGGPRRLQHPRKFSAAPGGTDRLRVTPDPTKPPQPDGTVHGGLRPSARNKA
jgi:hypothetical protein